MSLLIASHYKLAYDSLRQNRFRSFLTCLGIAIGVASIVLILSLMGSVNNLVSSQVKAMGSDLILVRPATHRDQIDNLITELASSNQYLGSSLRLSDVEAIKKVNGVSAAAPIATAIYTLTAEKSTDAGNVSSVVESASVVGTSASFTSIQSLPLKSGTFLSTQASSAVVGRDLSLQLFGTTEPIGKTFTLQGNKFIVVGILEETADPINFNNIDYDNTMFVDASYLAKIDTALQVQQINVKATNTSSLATTAEGIYAALSAAKSGDTNFGVYYGDQISHPAGSLLNIVSGMLTIVAGVSLVVGGIGVMNIMLVSVAERTREIGIRKAVGATSGHILLQFLFESLILASLGGVLGLGLGYGLAFLISVITPFTPYIDINILMITLATSIAVGVVFGLYPAAKAARKNPIESLRYYR